MIGIADSGHRDARRHGGNLIGAEGRPREVAVYISPSVVRGAAQGVADQHVAGVKAQPGIVARAVAGLEGRVVRDPE